LRILCCIVALAANGIIQGKCSAQATQIEHAPSNESPPFVVQLDDPTMLRDMVTFADCVVTREPKAVIHFLREGNFAVPQNGEVRSIVQRNRACLRVANMRFNQVLFAGAASESLYRVSGLFFAKVSMPITKPVNDPGMCVAMAKPKEVDNLLAAFPASSEEKAALAALDAAIERCHPNTSPHASIRRAAVMAGMFPVVYDLFLGPRSRQSH